MREYEKIAKRVGLIVAVATLMLQIIFNEISYLTINLFMKLILAVIAGFITFSISNNFPRLAMRERELCGLYMITYNDAKANLCSILNINYNKSIDKYLIDLYDCYLQGSNWVAVESQYPISLKNIFFSLEPRGIHIVSNDDNCNTCIFIRFTYKVHSGNVIRYGGQKPFHKSHSGKFVRLSSGQLCEVYNNTYQDYHFCSRFLSKHGKCKYERCKYEERKNCNKRKKIIWNKVREKGNYIQIAKVLYNNIVASIDPSGNPADPSGPGGEMPKKTKKKNKPQKVLDVGKNEKKDVNSDVPVLIDAKEVMEKEQFLEGKDSVEHEIEKVAK